jgi:hypothetical protein
MPEKRYDGRGATGFAAYLRQLRRSLHRNKLLSPVHELRDVCRTTPTGRRTLQSRVGRTPPTTPRGT